MFGQILSMATPFISKLFGGQKSTPGGATADTSMVPVPALQEPEKEKPPGAVAKESFLGGLMKSIGEDSARQLVGAGRNAMLAPLRGRAAGRGAKAYHDAAHPGTNPWERLGAGNPGGAQQISGEAQSLQERMQSKDLASKEKIARIQADTQLKTAGISAQAPGRMADYHHARLPRELQNLDAQFERELTHARLMRDQAVMTGHMARARRWEAELAEKAHDPRLSKEQAAALQSWLNLGTAVYDRSPLGRLSRGPRAPANSDRRKNRSLEGLDALDRRGPARGGNHSRYGNTYRYRPGSRP